MITKLLLKLPKIICSPIAYYKRAFFLYKIRHMPSNEIKRKITAMRSKEKIRIAFVLYDVAKWKSEYLYLKMLAHPRFEPILVVVSKRESDYLVNVKDFLYLIDYLKNKSYKFIIGKPNISLTDLVQPDLVFWGEPYKGKVDDTYRYEGNMNVLSAYIPYCFHNMIIPQTNNYMSLNHYWMLFFENQSCINDLRSIVDNKCANYIASGLPICDNYLSYENKENPWKQKIAGRKKIIWAPSHTIPGTNNCYEQSTFLTIAEDMLHLTQKYKDCTQWAFKPHPVLKKKLVDLWGYEKANEYYNKWAEGENTQLEEGNYISLFMNSDALIHDCQSFMLEYMFTEKPVLFLDNGKNASSIWNTQTRKAYDAHYHSSSIQDVELFLNQLFKGEDPKFFERKNFKDKFLIPPYGKKASENIINAILSGS